MAFDRRRLLVYMSTASRLETPLVFIASELPFPPLFLNASCFGLFFHQRPDFDKSWTLIQEQIQMDSMVIKGLSPDTNYQFAVKAMNPHGASPRSQPSATIRTPGEYQRPSEGRTWPPGCGRLTGTHVVP